ncbi:MAG: STAS/SEC14 domain-containing protein [Flavobacteriales bacterium]|jgi:hypothetical protein|nr:STAS/SEC14 domain-containing protein [Flavobacteriales bacterium]
MSQYHSSAHAEFDSVNYIAVIVLNGDLEVEPLAKTLAQADAYLADLSASGLPPLGLADARDLTGIKLEARKHGVQWLRSANYTKFAVVGNNLFVKYFVNGLVKVIGNPMRYFTSYEEAFAWLKED